MNLTRRNFLKGAGAGAITLASTMLLGGCTGGEEVTNTENKEPETITEYVTKKLNEQDESYDSYSNDVSAIFTPIKVGHMELRNRIIKSSAGSDTLPKTAKEMSQNSLDYYGLIADGGTSLIIIDSSGLGPFGFNPFKALGVDSIEIGINEGKKLADRIHEGGAYAGYQFGIGTPMDPGDVNAYTIDEIKQMIKNYGDCAERLKQAGFDCVEMKGATNDGLNQFLSRSINRREDEYGAQNNENRVRFFKEIIEEIRSRCGDDFSILVLINAVEENDLKLGQNDKYIIVEEAQYLAQALEGAGADLIQVRIGTPGQEITCWAPDCNHTGYNMHGATGYGDLFNYESHFGGLLDGAHNGVGAFVTMANKIKEVVSIPVGCGGYMDPRTAPDMMNNAVKNGDIDVIFMNRPLIVDPELPNKLKEGRRDEIAPCTRCLHCHGIQGGEVENCRVNATTQYAYTDLMPEGYNLTPADMVKNILVIGGGPAGMEAARVAAMRGHKVKLVDKNSTLGHGLDFASAFKGKHERLGDLKNYLINQQTINNVEVITGVEADVNYVTGLNPDVVVVATGGMRKHKLSSSSNVDVFSIENFSHNIGENVVIIGGNLQAIDTALYLLAENKKVTIVNPKETEQLDIEQSFWVRRFSLAHLYANGVKIFNSATVESVNNSSIIINMDNGFTREIECNTVIECYDMVENSGFINQLKDAGFKVQSAGCINPKNIQAAINDGYLVGRYI